MSTHREREGSQNRVEANIHLLGELVAEKNRDSKEKIKMIEDLKILSAPDDALIKLAMLRMDTQQLVDTLPAKQEIIADIIRRYAIETEIDENFLRQMLIIADRHLKTPEEERDEEFLRQEQEVVTNVINSLNDRRARERLTRENEQKHEVEISGGPVFNFFVSQDGESVRMDLPIITDPNKTRVAIGPEAVVEILGAKLTFEDYDRIAETLLSFKGGVGRVIRAYAFAVETWADLSSQGFDASETRDSRRLRSYAIRKTFNGEDPKIGPFVDIPLNSIFTYVTKRYPLIALKNPPQPFSE